MYYTGFADEAARDIDGQIAATRELGWHFIESRNIDGVNIHDLPEAQFETACAKLQDAHIQINCFGSAVANWQHDPFSDADFEQTTQQLKRALKRMQVLNCKMIRAMSFTAQWERPRFDAAVEKQVFYKVGELVKMCEDAGVIYLHENCNNYGGQSWQHTLKLLDHIKSPNFKLVFDTGNPVMNYDRQFNDELDPMQSSWDFYSHVKEFIYYVHIKDGKLRTKKIGFSEADYTFPGEGDGDVRKIVTDLVSNGYDGGFSMEPHMATVLHDANGQRDEKRCRTNYVEYGRRFMSMVEGLKNQSKHKTTTKGNQECRNS